MNTNPQYVDISGLRFGRWTVVEKAGKTKDNHQMWLCRCDCGVTRDVTGKDLRVGKSRSCGCISKEIFQDVVSTHNLHSHPLYVVWSDIKSRCYNKNNPSFRNYGARGIEMDRSWINDPQVFIEWCLGNGYKDGLEIDRIDNDGDYSPDNCRFVDHKTNSRNKRTNHYVTWNGTTKTVVEWSIETGINEATIRNRLKRGWDVEKALTTPPMFKKVVA